MILRPVIPAPRVLVQEDGDTHFGKINTLRVAPGALTEATKAEFSALFRRFTLDSGVLSIEETPSLPPFCAALNTLCDAPERAGEDEYVLTVSPSGAALSASDSRGLIHAFFTLLQLIVPVSADEFALPCLRIADRPLLENRMIHLCVFPETTLTLLEKAVRLAGLMKYTHVILEFWGTLRYDCLSSLSWPGVSFSKDQIRPLLSLIRALGMEPVPMLNHLGHATQSRNCFGRHTVLDQDLSKALLFEPDGWTWCVSNPETRALLAAMRAELIELFGPGQYFHLGCDESYSFATCPVCSRRKPSELLAEWLNELTADLGQSGRRPIIWGDQLLDSSAWPRPNMASSQPDQQTHLALPLLDRRLVIADWQYDITSPDLPTARHLRDQGFDVLACPWDNDKNIIALGQAAAREQLPGLMATTWDHLPAFLSRMDLPASLGWNGRSERPRSIHAEIAALLRRVMPHPVSYDDAGFNSYEVMEFPCALKNL